MPMLSILSGTERCCHPIGAKYHMNLEGVPMTINSRSADKNEFGKLQRIEIEDVQRIENFIRAWLAE